MVWMIWLLWFDMVWPRVKGGNLFSEGAKYPPRWRDERAMHRYELLYIGTNV